MKRSLFVTSNRLGDAVLTTGILHHMIAEEPDIPVTVVCGHIPKDIFESIPGVERVIPIRKLKYSMHWPKAAWELGFRRWHRIVDFRASLLGFLPAKHRYIWPGGMEGVHKTMANARLIGLDRPVPPKILSTPAQQAAADRLLNWPEDPRPIIALAPTANFYQKQWSHRKYLALAEALTAPDGILPGARIAVFGAPGEQAQAMPVVEGLPDQQVIDLVGKTTPMEAASLLSRAALFVGNDSGLMHTAVAVNVPTVGLFGIGQPDVYGPVGDKTLCLIGDPAGIPIADMPENDPHAGKDVLPLDRVLEEVERFWKRLPRPDQA
ncbi:glycosyltransferase family 9 protein [Sneathiella chinensis]|uniref:Glycosyl transferase n=1 Tax=Sneathiella chinensis TaxID=349750 RepID=A0ABQ5U7Y1_9PROT|nr:glycosyltransferase family 9 protein [Sneathiella chinensis]GLQ07906.1 glycosyl transferase [Sneathiella chinensis]